MTWDQCWFDICTGIGDIIEILSITSNFHSHSCQIDACILTILALKNYWEILAKMQFISMQTPR